MHSYSVTSLAINGHFKENIICSIQAGEDVVAVEGGKSNLTNMFKPTPQQKEARRNKLLLELSEAEEALGPAQSDLEQFVTEADLEVLIAILLHFLCYFFC